MHLSLGSYRTDRPASPVFLNRLPTVAVRREPSLWLLTIGGACFGAVAVLALLALV